MNFFSQYSPVRSFPAYTGPYRVGSCDVEVPVSGLDSPATSPDESIGTVAFRTFYPCEDDGANRPVKWVPSPQSRYGSAYCRFLGASPTVADILALFPQFLYMTKIPVHRNGKLLQPSTSSHRWPVVVFSHGLGGSRNAYSHICGSLASYGIIVIAPDHRDSSAPISFVRATDTTAAKDVPYKKMSHTPSHELYDARDQQLRIRTWELGCIHDAIVKMDLGQCPKNLDPNHSNKGKRTEVMEMFRGKMNLHQPGSIAWAGHSFGATTMVQFLKSAYYGTPSETERPLFVPDRSAHLIKQVTNSSVALLLDLWCLPLRSETSRYLWNKPMPCYDTTASTSWPAGGQALVSVLSEAFYIWEGNLNDTKRILLPHGPAPDSNLRWVPYFFYPKSSAHLSQSDFGILFPWITSKVLKTKEPGRLLRLNARAMLQVLRVNGFEIASPTPIDLETVETSQPKQKAISSNGSSESVTDEKVPVMHDIKILTGEVRDWVRVEFGRGEAEGDGESGMHVEDDYQSPEVDGAEPDEAEILAQQTPGREKGEREALGVGKTTSRSREVPVEETS